MKDSGLTYSKVLIRAKKLPIIETHGYDWQFKLFFVNLSRKPDRIVLFEKAGKNNFSLVVRHISTKLTSY